MPSLVINHGKEQNENGSLTIENGYNALANEIGFLSEPMKQSE